MNKLLKTIISLTLILALAVVPVEQAEAASKGLELTEENPFLNGLWEYDVNEDGYLSEEEAANVWEDFSANEEVSSKDLEVLSYFPRCEDVYLYGGCSDSKLILPENVKRCNITTGKSIAIEGPSLTFLCLETTYTRPNGWYGAKEYDSIDSVDLSACTKLTSLSFAGNIGGIDAGNSASLEDIYITGTTGKLNLSSSTELSRISIRGTVTDLKLPKNNNIKSIDFEGSSGAFDFSKVPNLEEVSFTCFYEGDTVDLKSCTSLTSIFCYHAKINSLSLPKSKGLTMFDSYYSSIKKLDASSATSLEALYCQDAGTEELILPKTNSLKILDCSDNALKTLSVAGTPNLTTLTCDGNQLKSLDASKLKNLEKLYCYNNKLTKLDVSNCSKLTVLNASNNALTSLNVTKNTKLDQINCSFNSIEKLDLSKNKNLTRLDCSNNKLTTLNVANSKKIELVSCFGNSLKNLYICKSGKKTDVIKKLNSPLAIKSVKYDYYAGITTEKAKADSYYYFYLASNKNDVVSSYSIESVSKGEAASDYLTLYKKGKYSVYSVGVTKFDNLFVLYGTSKYKKTITLKEDFSWY